MKGRLVGKFGAQDGVASAQCDVEVVEGLDNGRRASPAKVISYVLGVTSGLDQSAKYCARHQPGGLRELCRHPPRVRLLSPPGGSARREERFFSLQDPGAPALSPSWPR